MRHLHISENPSVLCSGLGQVQRIGIGQISGFHYLRILVFAELLGTEPLRLVYVFRLQAVSQERGSKYWDSKNNFLPEDKEQFRIMASHYYPCRQIVNFHCIHIEFLSNNYNEGVTVLKC